MSEEAPASVAGVQPIFAQCMLRVKHLDASRDFYEGKLGMKYLTRLDFEDGRFSLIFFAYTDDDTPGEDAPRPQRAEWLWSRPYPTIELTWNWPDESGVDDEQYVNGNTEPKGFGYTAIIVDDVQAAVDALVQRGVALVQKRTLQNGVATACIADPDGYWVKLQQRTTPSTNSQYSMRGVIGNDPVLSRAMLRVRDPRTSIAFFQKLGYRYVTRIDVPEDEYSSFFLAYTDADGPPEQSSAAEKAKWVSDFRAFLVELRHEWGTETANEDLYVNGNVRPYRGFGHLGIIVSDIYDTTSKMETEGYGIVRKASPFKDVGSIAFVKDPDTGYWVEIIERTGEVPSAPYQK